MSRRESRVSMNVRQNDALFEFENFKKKFLLANKHITKLNSTLSVRIEELNAQISTLYVENLRLRASEIALAAQLKREREKSRKVMADTETAALNLTKHLSYLRQTFNIRSASPTPPTPPSPRARRPPPPNANPSSTPPQMARVSRPPDIPGIVEDDEPCPSSSEPEKQPSPQRRKAKPKPRLSASRLPLPSRVSTPPPLLPPPAAPVHVDLASGMKRKPTRRQSGLLVVNTNPRAVDEPLSVPRVPSPAFGSPMRREAGLAEQEDEEVVLYNGMEMEVDEVEPVKRDKRRGKGKDRESESEREHDVVMAESSRTRERKRPREEDDGTTEGGKSRLKDVTNSPQSRTAFLPIDNTVIDQPDAEPDSPTTRAFITSLPTTPSLPTPRPSASPPAASESEGGVNTPAPGGRERRTRKSVNYAEPKLNTKMRKPDPQAGTAPPPPQKKRSSAAAVMTSYKPSEDNENDADNDTEARSSLELPRVNGNHVINPEMLPLPPSRPASSASMFAPPPPSLRTYPNAHGSVSGSTSTSGSVVSSGSSVKKKKSRPQVVMEDEDSDGAQADGEYGGRVGWVNVDGRRRGVPQSNGQSLKRGLVLDDAGRRHSLAV